MSDRKVHFSVPIHQVEYLDKQWETASRLARDGSDWLRMGLDRIRFRDRIERSAELLNEVLSSDHRSHIYQVRFEKFEIPSSEPVITTTRSRDETTDSPPVLDELHNVIEKSDSSHQPSQSHNQQQKEQPIRSQLNQPQQQSKRRRRRKHSRRKHKS